MAVRYEIYNEAPAVEKDMVVRFALRKVTYGLCLDVVDKNGDFIKRLLYITKQGKLRRCEVAEVDGFKVNACGHIRLDQE